MPGMANTPHPTVKGLKGWIEVFRAGTHMDSKGRSCTYSTADLDQMVANVALGKPPAVLGHPKHDDPAYGWATLKRDGASLYAQFEDVHPSFAAGVDSGAYRNRSVCVLKDPQHGWRVRHIGWLGAAPPAIDGLKPLQFSAADDAELHEYSGDDMRVSWALGDVAVLFRRLRDWLIADKGLEQADQLIPDYQINSINSAAEAVRAAAIAETEPSPAYTAPPSNQGDPMPYTAEDLQRAATEAEARVRAELQAQYSAQDTELTQLRTERQRERIDAQIKAWQAAGQLLPAEAHGLAEFMAALETGATAEFSFTAADQSAAKHTPAAWFAQFMAARKPALRLGQQQADDDTDPPTQGSATDNAAIAAQARSYMAEQQAAGRVITIGAAIDHVTSKAKA